MSKAYGFAASAFFVLHACTFTSSTYQPSMPAQPSMPKSNRSWIVSPGEMPIAARLICVRPQLPKTSPPSVPL